MKDPYAKPTTSHLKLKGKTETLYTINPAMTNPQEIRQAIRRTAKAQAVPVDQILFINTGPGYQAQVFYIELTKPTTTG